MTNDTGDDPSDRRSGDFRAARIGAASALTAVVVILLIADVVTGSAYDINPMVLVSLLGTVMTLLGIEAISLIRGGK